MDSIDGKVAFVTGAAGGMGLGIADALLNKGARVVLADIDAPELELQVKERGSSARAFVMDVSNGANWDEARTFVESEFGPVDILVSNAGIGPDLRLLTEMTTESFYRLLSIKVGGCFHSVRAFGSGMQERASGHIVFTASMAGLMANPRLGGYTAANFGVVGMSEVLRAEMTPYGVGVSVLCPGTVVTRLRETTRAITGSDELAAKGGDFVSPSNSALSPQTIGELVVDAILANQLYIFSHGEYRVPVGARCDALMSAFAGAQDR